MNRAVNPTAVVVGKTRLELPEGPFELDILEGTEKERAIDIRKLRATTGYVTLDDGFTNTGSCASDITFIDGEKGMLRFRGFPIEQVAKHCTFPETAFLLINGQPPTARELKKFSGLLTEYALLHEGLRYHFEGFPPDAHPMAILSAMINSTSCYHPDLLQIGDENHLMEVAAKLLSKVRTIAAFAYKKSKGQPIVHPDPDRNYCNNLLHMMFSLPYKDYDPSPAVVNAIRLFFILHADHEQNCSTSTARMVGSSGANMFAAVSAAVCALWGPLHGGANMRVIQMLQRIHSGEQTVDGFIEKVKRRDDLMWGFGHRVYKNFDPRTKILKKACDELFEAQGAQDPLLDIARQMEQIAVEDEYFLERKLYPNVDFYSGILLRAIGIPMDMYTVMFAIGRMPGWIAHWTEGLRAGSRIHRPRQIYTGPMERDFISIDRR